jgi:hypothetical protein
MLTVSNNEVRNSVTVANFRPVRQGRPNARNVLSVSQFSPPVPTMVAESFQRLEKSFHDRGG